MTFYAFFFLLYTVLNKKIQNYNLPMLLALFLCSIIFYDHFLNYLISSCKIIAPMALSSLLVPEYTGIPFFRLSCLLSLSLTPFGPDTYLTQYSKGTLPRKAFSGRRKWHCSIHTTHLHLLCSCCWDHQLTSHCLSGIVFISTEGK